MSEEKHYNTDAQGFLKSLTVKVPAREVKLTKKDIGNYITADLIPLLLCIDETPRSLREIRKMVQTVEMTHRLVGYCDEHVLKKFLSLMVSMGFVVRSKEGNRQYRYRRKTYTDAAEERLKDGRI
jgi:hypothetical protein